MSPTAEKEALDRFQSEISAVVVGADRQIRLLSATLLSGGHLLVEDRPGTGKTTIAKAAARALRADFRRVQLTPDLLPSDITGGTVYLPDSGTLEFRPGPIFTDLLLADELNRAAPRTQSALLEAMAEGQVTIDGVTRALGESFTVMATVNPIDSHGVQPLPEAELDRFLCSFNIGYPTVDREIALIEARHKSDPLESVAEVLTLRELGTMRAAVREVSIRRELLEYVARLLEITRRDEELRLGASPRAGLGWVRFSQALAFLDGSDHVRPEHLQEAALPTLRHRVFVKEEGGNSDAGEEWLTRILSRLPLPR